MDNSKYQRVGAWVAIIIVTVMGILVAMEFLSMRNDSKLYPSGALTETKMLSHYHPALLGTHSDSEVYIFKGEQPGGKLLILGGTHPNEPAGFLTAALMLENISVQAGEVYILPRANKSAFTHNDPQEGQPQTFSLSGRHGQRTFRYGSRVTNPVDQWPDPEIYLHYPSNSKLAGNETRNLNRAYPGKPDGNMTEQIAWSIMELIRTENIDLAFDLHEAAPEYPVVNAIVAGERTQDIIAEAGIYLEMNGFNYSIEPSPYNFRGLSHREWNDHSDVYPVLLETANPIQGRLRGKTDEALLVTGKDKMYERSVDIGVLYVLYDSTGIPLTLRVGRHLEAIYEIVNTFSSENPENNIEFSSLPSLEELQENGFKESIY